ncbi:glycosyltransferase [Dehalobacter sp. DCM]|uniref:glycosyltransferase n=1 Tax=Dehalobacter sp. DCM TaxID=2907827 RepID=UPI003FCC4ECA
MDPGIAEEIISPDAQHSPGTTPPPFISFVTFNRMGLTIQNINNILNSDENFEMHIIDCNSKDDTWEYIKGLQDERIKSKTRFCVNRGPIYVLNYNLKKRKPNQYFFTIDSDVFIRTKDWLSKYIAVFEAFPEVGLLGVMRDNPYPRYLPPVIPRVKGDLSYLQLKNAAVDVIMDFIPGSLQGLRPELFEQIGYWSEECGYGDAELSPRITHYTSYKVGFMTNVEIDMTQSIGCDQCAALNSCSLNKSVKTCFMLAKQTNRNESFAKYAKWKYLELFNELAEGKRTAYCASLLDPASREGHVYHETWALENFEYYLRRSN